MSTIDDPVRSGSAPGDAPQPLDPGTPALHVAAAELRHADEVLGLVHAMGGHADTTASGFIPAFRAAVTDPRTRALVALAGDTVIGYAEVQRRTLPVVGRTEGWLAALVVHPSRRGEGVGARLLEAAQQAAQDLGGQTMTVDTSSWRTDAHRFYERAGFTRATPAERLVLPLAPAPGEAAPAVGPLPDRSPWPTPEPAVPRDCDPLLAAVVQAAAAAFGDARRRHAPHALAEQVADGADGTPTMRLDALVEAAIAEVADRYRVNLLSEELGLLDHSSAVTVVVDPLDGSANAVAGVPLCATAAVLVRDGRPEEALTCWLDTGRCWAARADRPAAYRTTGRQDLPGAAVSLLRPHARNAAAWWRVAEAAGRVRILSTSCLEAMLVAEGATDAFADAGSDTHRLVDLAAALVAVPAAGGAVIDADGRPIEFHPDLTRRWSGVVAATPALAGQLAATIRG